MSQKNKVLEVQRRAQADKTPKFRGQGMTLVITPPISEDYWTYRVQLSPKQAVVGFPKFSTIGIGFAVEEDWNTNLPYTSSAEEIYEHIKHNKGDRAITKAACLDAIRRIQEAAASDRQS